MSPDLPAKVHTVPVAARLPGPSLRRGPRMRSALVSEPVPARFPIDKDAAATTIICALLLVEGCFLLACLLYV